MTIDGFGEIMAKSVAEYFDMPENIELVDRLMAAAGADLMFKPAACVASARRAGTTATLDVLNKYFLYNQMPLVSSNYWWRNHRFLAA